MNLFIILISVGCLVASGILAVFTQRIFKKIAVKPIYILLVGAFFAIFVLMLGIDYKPSVHGANTTFFLAIMHTIQIMTAGYEFDFLYDALDIADQYAEFVYAYCSFLFFLAPVYTFGFVLSFFESLTAYIKYILSRNKDIYLLSDLNDRTVEFAKSVRAKDPKAIVAVMNIAGVPDEMVSEYKEQLRAIKPLYFNKAITDVKLKFHSKRTKACFIMVHEEESYNIESALELIDRFRDREKTEIYVFSTSHGGQYLLDAVDNGAIKVRRINEPRIFAYTILSEKPIVENYTIVDGQKLISTLIVGFGGYGCELVKGLLWCGQLPGYDLKLNIIDADETAESRFRMNCPEIMRLNGNREMGEARYDIRFHCGVDVGTYALDEVVATLQDTSVVYVSLGNDDLNVETAIRLRILFERMGVYPVIRAVLYSDIKCKMLEEYNLVNHKGENYDIEIIGNIADRFSYDTISNEHLEKMALECHLRWASTPEETEKALKLFNQYEYYRNSSLATALHENYRRNLNISEDRVDEFEHMRWNAYMRTEGFVFSGSCDPKTRNDRAKMHNNLHTFDMLSDADIEKDRRMVQK